MFRRPRHRVAGLLAALLLAAACSQGDPAAPTLMAVQLGPAHPSVAAGRDLRLTALGLWSDGRSRVVSSGLTWSSSDGGVATVDGAGVARGVSPGTVTVSALEVASGRTASVALTVTEAVLESLLVSPASSTLPAGLAQGFTAEGHLSDGATRQLTSEVTWSSSSPDVAAPDAAGVVRALRPGATTILASHAASGLSASAALTVTSAVVQRLDVAPTAVSLAPGLARQLAVVAHLSDGSAATLGLEATWSTSSAATATVDATGLLQALAPGLADVTATYGPTGAAATVAVTVTDATLERLALEPAPSVPLGLAVPLTVTGHGSDGTSGPVVGGLTWSVADPAVAWIDAAGLAHGLAVGSTAVTVTHGPSGLGAGVTLAVTPAVLQSLAMAPATATLAVGQRFDPWTPLFSITGTFSDGQRRFLGPYFVVPLGATPFVWSTSDASVAQVGTSGRVTTLAPGAATITARDPASGLTAASVVIVVPDVQVGVSVSPQAATLQAGEWTSLLATGDFLSGSASLIYVGSFPGAWTTSAPTVATVSDQGSVRAVAPGVATITFTDPRNGFADSATITVQ